MARDMLSISLKEIIGDEEGKAFLRLLSSVGQAPLAIFDFAGDLAAAFFDFNGAGKTFQQFQQQGFNGNQAACPCDSQQPKAGRKALCRKIRFQGRDLGRICSCFTLPQEEFRAGQTLQLAESWIHEKIQAEYYINNLSREILNKYEELNLFYELSADMISSFNTQQFCEKVLQKVLGVISAEEAAILLLDTNEQQLQVMATFGLTREGLAEWEKGVNKHICDYVVKTRRPLLLETMADLPAEALPDNVGANHLSTLSFAGPSLVSPLNVKEKMIGVISLSANPHGEMYHASDLKLLAAISSEVALSIYNSLLIFDLKDNERLQKEMEIAEEVQKNLFPRHPPEIPGVEMVGRCLPAKRVGGDYFDFFPDDEGGVGIVLADVSGHGIGSGIMMAITRGFLQGEALRSKAPHLLLENVNRMLFNDLCASELFLTMVYFYYDSERKWLSYANGGHNPPVLIPAEGGQPRLLDAEGMAIGILPHVTFEEEGRQLAPGDLLVLYTDGFIEAQDEQGRQFGMERFLRHLQAYRHQPAREILEGLLKALWEHIGGQDPQSLQKDDTTLVVFKVEE